MFDYLKRKSEDNMEAERACLMNMSEKQLMVEMILELKRISAKCDEIGRKIIIWNR